MLRWCNVLSCVVGVLSRSGKLFLGTKNNEHMLLSINGIYIPSVIKNISTPNIPAPWNVLTAASATCLALWGTVESRLLKGAKTKWQMLSLWIVSTAG